MASGTNAFSPGIFIMMKHPEVGKVKMRLAKSLGEKDGTGLYRAFIQDTITKVQSLDVPYRIAVYPPESQEMIIQWLGQVSQVFPQLGMNLGERLQNGFRMMFEKGYQQVIALASDSPDLPNEILMEAVSGLQTHNAVIGPASDGGYYLIGFSRGFFIPEAFEGVSWSTETVFKETMSRIGSRTSQVYVLPEWADIDTNEDLREFYKRNRVQPSRALHTMNYLNSHPKLLQSLLS
jgi:rSAM/selenodomain-associated transferase 1